MPAAVVRAGRGSASRHCGGACDGADGAAAAWGGGGGGGGGSGGVGSAAATAQRAGMGLAAWCAGAASCGAAARSTAGASGAAASGATAASACGSTSARARLPAASTRCGAAAPASSSTHKGADGKRFCTEADAGLNGAILGRSGTAHAAAGRRTQRRSAVISAALQHNHGALTGSSSSSSSSTQQRSRLSHTRRRKQRPSQSGVALPHRALRHLRQLCGAAPCRHGGTQYTALHCRCSSGTNTGRRGGHGQQRRRRWRPRLQHSRLHQMQGRQRSSHPSGP